MARRRPSLRALALLALALPVAASGERAGADALAQAGPPPAQRVRELQAEGRLAEALEATAAIEDPLLAAEWRFHVLYAGGDLPAALRAALEGLESAPRHLGLLANAANAALSLGRGELARDLSLGLQAAAREPGIDPEVARRESERAGRYLSLAEREMDLERRAQRALARARAVAIAAVVLGGAALVVLGRRGRRGMGMGEV